MNNIEICPICKKHYTKRNYSENHHLKYANPEETMIGCKNCNTAEYYYRHPEKLSTKSWFWKWWWGKRIKLVMEYYKENRIMLKSFEKQTN